MKVKRLIIALVSSFLLLLINGCSSILSSDETADNSSFADNESDKLISLDVDFNGQKYVVNTTTQKIHKLTCRDVDKIQPDKKRYTNADYKTLIQAGYTPCGKCNPSAFVTYNSEVKPSLTPDKEANEIINSYNLMTDLGEITENDITWEMTGAGYHTYISRGGITYEICYADSFVRTMAKNESVSSDVFMKDMEDWLRSVLPVGAEKAKELIEESASKGKSVNYNKNTITCNGSYFSYSDDSWY